MSYFRECPFCGTYLDPGEICDCRAESAASRRDKQEEQLLNGFRRLEVEEQASVFRFVSLLLTHPGFSEAWHSAAPEGGESSSWQQVLAFMDAWEGGAASNGRSDLRPVRAGGARR